MFICFEFQAVNNFYCNASLQEEVHRWLTTAQISQEAWSFSWELLAPNKVGTFCCCEEKTTH